MRVAKEEQQVQQQQQQQQQYQLALSAGRVAGRAQVQ